MTMTGVVTRIVEKGAWLDVKQCNPLRACGGGGCHACNNGREKPKLPVWVACANDIQPGDNVEVDVLLPGIVPQILTVFGLPIVSSVCFGIAGHILHPDSDHYVGMMAGAVVGLAIGFGGMIWCSRSLHILRATGRIIRVLEPA